MPNPGDIVTIQGCPCCGSSSSSSSKSSSSSSSGDPPCLCGHVSAFQFTISGVHYKVNGVSHSDCDPINGTFTLTRQVLPLIGGGGYVCQWYAAVPGVFGSLCNFGWTLFVTQGTGTIILWHLQLAGGGSCAAPCVGWDGYAQTTGCATPSTFIGQQADWNPCYRCYEYWGPVSLANTPTLPSSITLTAL